MEVENALIYLSSVDEKMKGLIDCFPKPVFNSTENKFSTLIKYLIYQQLSGKSASAIFERYKLLFKNHSYRNPNNVLSINQKRLKEIGLSKQKILYIRNVSQAFIKGEIPDSLSNFSNSEVKEFLIKIKGVGPWTVDMFLMFTLQRKDVMPFSDLGVQKGFVKSELWKPFRTIASLYLWHLVDDGFVW